ADALRAAGVRTIALGHLAREIGLFADLRALLELRRLFRRERPDIVHLNSSKAGGLGALAARLARVPHIIYTAHGGWTYSRLYAAPVRFAMRAAFWCIVLLSHRTICVSASERAGLSR